MKKKVKQKCVFFDRDGIANESPGQDRYVTRWNDFHLIPEFPICLQSVLKMGYQAALVTNQRAVAKGLMSIKDLENIHRRLRRLLRRQYGLTLLDIAYCPHDTNECSCRKPSPGMILAMADKHNLDLAASWMIGDSETDIEAGRRAGCRTILVAGSPRLASMSRRLVRHSPRRSLLASAEPLAKPGRRSLGSSLPAHHSSLSVGGSGGGSPGNSAGSKADFHVPSMRVLAKRIRRILSV